MIDLEWVLSAMDPVVEPELRELLAVAAAADAEAGFPQMSLGESAAQLLVWLLPDERAGQLGRSLAAYLRVDHSGEVFYVVRPEYRSRGITTLMLEKVGLGVQGPDGWQGTGLRSLRIWARGNHPAALRMALRFRRLGIRTAARQWQMVIALKPGREVDPGAEPGGPVVRPVTSNELGPLSGEGFVAHSGEVLMAGEATGALWLRTHPAEPSEYGAAGRIEAVRTSTVDRTLTRALLVAGLERIRDRGLRAGLITVDAQDEMLVHEARSLGLMHDQTDVLYTVGVAP